MDPVAPRPIDNDYLMIGNMDDFLRKNVVRATKYINKDLSFPPEGGRWCTGVGLNEEQINSFFTTKPFQTFVDCFAVALIIMAKGLICTLYPGEFDDLGLKTSYPKYYLGKKEHMYLKDDKSVNKIDQMKVGDWTYLENNYWYSSVHPKGGPWSGENIIKVEGGSKNSEPVYYGFGSTDPMTYEKWIDALADGYNDEVYMEPSDVISHMNPLVFVLHGPILSKITSREQVPGFTRGVRFFDTTELWQAVKKFRHDRHVPGY